MLLTGTRRTESGSLLWSNVDLEASTYYLPPEVVKNHNGVTLLVLTSARDIEGTKALPLSARRSPSVAGGMPTASTAPTFPRGAKPDISPQRRRLWRRSLRRRVSMSASTTSQDFDDMAQRCKVGENESRQLLNHMASDVHGKHYSNNPDPPPCCPPSKPSDNGYSNRRLSPKQWRKERMLLPLRA